MVQGIDNPRGVNPKLTLGSVATVQRFRSLKESNRDRRPIRAVVSHSKPSGNDQASSTENVNENQAVLPVGGETSEQSAHQEPSLTQALGYMPRVLQTVDQNIHQSTAQLDMVPVAITAYNENIVQIRQLFTRNEQTYGGQQVPLNVPVQQNPVMPAVL
uniref:Uncharacterized protein n=1 Tax=Ananas comosus var. bracteatus TaxID=296719 RepID=A0A6V7NWR1_ANACO|nr:unnamed protein product [Ananas comosus var. bracteatus]